MRMGTITANLSGFTAMWAGFNMESGTSTNS